MRGRKLFAGENCARVETQDKTLGKMVRGSKMTHVMRWCVGRNNVRGKNCARRENNARQENGARDKMVRGPKLMCDHILGETTRVGEATFEGETTCVSLRSRP